MDQHESFVDSLDPGLEKIASPSIEAEEKCDEPTGVEAIIEKILETIDPSTFTRLRSKSEQRDDSMNNKMIVK